MFFFQQPVYMPPGSVSQRSPFFFGESMLVTDVCQVKVKSGKGSRKKVNSADRLKRSRERNRIHARKTRQRKKEQMQTLSSKAEELKGEQLRLRQVINEKNTANILVGLFAKSSSNSRQPHEDPRVEELLQRPASDIPDASKVPELPALILPGQHASKKIKDVPKAPPNDGIDYDLLGKDRSKCSPEELDRIRRERNRMHAKRTRDRKRLFTEQMSEICRQLEEENAVLRKHLSIIDPDYVAPVLASSPKLEPTPSSTAAHQDVSLTPSTCPSFHAQISTLLEAAGTFERQDKNLVVALSDDSSSASTLYDEEPPSKRQRFSAAKVAAC